MGYFPTFLKPIKMCVCEIVLWWGTPKEQHNEKWPRAVEGRNGAQLWDGSGWKFPPPCPAVPVSPHLKIHRFHSGSLALCPLRRKTGGLSCEEPSALKTAELLHLGCSVAGICFIGMAWRFTSNLLEVLMVAWVIYPVLRVSAVRRHPVLELSLSFIMKTFNLSYMYHK